MAARNALGCLSRAGTMLSAVVMPLTRPTRADSTLGARISDAHRQSLHNQASYSAPLYPHDKQLAGKNLRILSARDAIISFITPFVLFRNRNDDLDF